MIENPVDLLQGMIRTPHRGFLEQRSARAARKVARAIGKLVGCCGKSWRRPAPEIAVEMGGNFE